MFAAVMPGQVHIAKVGEARTMRLTTPTNTANLIELRDCRSSFQNSLVFQASKGAYWAELIRHLWRIRKLSYHCGHRK